MCLYTYTYSASSKEDGASLTFHLHTLFTVHLLQGWMHLPATGESVLKKLISRIICWYIDRVNSVICYKAIGNNL